MSSRNQLQRLPLYLIEDAEQIWLLFRTGSMLADWVKLKEILIMRIWEDMSSQQSSPLVDQVDCSIYCLMSGISLRLCSFSGYLTARWACDR